MASSTYNTILITANGGHRPIFEYEADEALTPGELVRFDADDELEPHGTANGVAQKVFVVENPYATGNTSKAIDQDYALGDSARVIFGQPGDVVYAWLKAGVNAAKGDALTSDGAGALQKPTVDASLLSGAIVAFADEDKDNSGGGTRVRIKARVA
jgi:hypothetical protein